MKLTLKKKAPAPQSDCKPNLTWLWIHCIIFVVLIAAGIVPLASRLLSLQDEVIAVEQESLQQTREKVSMFQTQGQYETFAEDDFLERTFPSEDDVIQFIEFFEATAAANGVEHTLDLNNQDRTEAGATITIPFQMQVTGSLGYIVQFLNDIEKQDFYMTPNSITITNSTGENEEIVVISGNTFWTNTQQQ